MVTSNIVGSVAARRQLLRYAYVLGCKSPYAFNLQLWDFGVRRYLLRHCARVVGSEAPPGFLEAFAEGHRAVTHLFLRGWRVR